MQWGEGLFTSHANALVEDFQGFAHSLFSENRGGEFSLEVLFEAWAMSGRAIELAGGNFYTYLQAIVLIMAAFHADHTFLDNEEGTIGEWFDLSKDMPTCLYPEYWNQWVFQRTCGLTPSS